MEGHSFWILGLAPTRMSRILATKFLMAATALVAVSVGLMLLATAMLHVGTGQKWVAVGVAASVAITVSAVSTGLGAVFIDLKQPNPVAVISGFGGTVNLVISLGLMLALIVPFALVWHGAITGRLTDAHFVQGNILATAWLLLLTLLGTLLPLQLGVRSLKRREY